MLEIQMSKDIKDFEPKILGPFTMRQLVCLAISGAYGIPIFNITHGDIVTSVMITFGFMLPTIMCGWVKVYNEPLEKFALIIVKNKLIKPAMRKYKISGIYKEERKPEIKKIKRSKQIKGYK